MKSSQNSPRYGWLPLCLSLLAAPRIAFAHAAAPRSDLVTVDNAVQVANDKISIRQSQTYKGPVAQAIWDLIDTDKNGKVTAKEKEAFVPQAKTFFTEHSALRVNWAMPVPDDVAVDLASVPAKKPDLDKSGFGFALTAKYAYTPTALDLIELVIPNVNAHEIRASFKFEPSFRPLRVNAGTIDQSAVKDMVQTDGHPDAFSVIVNKQQQQQQQP
jgi:hypothetical protein